MPFTATEPLALNQTLADLSIKCRSACGSETPPEILGM